MAIYIYTNMRPWGVAHIPSVSEFSDLKSIMDWLNLTTWNDYKEKLHMPLAWRRNRASTTLQEQWNKWYYWSSTPYGSSYQTDVYIFFIDSSDTGALSHGNRAMWNSVRLFLDEYIEPDNTRTVVDGTLWSAGIFHNATLGIISITNGSDKNITMYDKNVGATTVYNSWDTLTETNCGKIFQRWNYYGFTYSWTISNTTATQVDTTWYGGNNPYSSSTFILRSSGSYDRSNPQNDNLRTDSKEEYFVIE